MEKQLIKKKPQSQKNIRLATNLTKLTEIIWRYQETQKLGSIEEKDLQKLTGWTHNHFKTILNILLNDPRSGVIRTPTGKIAYTW